MVTASVTHSTLLVIGCIAREHPEKMVSIVFSNDPVSNFGD